MVHDEGTKYSAKMRGTPHVERDVGSDPGGEGTRV